MHESIWWQVIKLIASGCLFCDSLKESSQLQCSGRGQQRCSSFKSPGRSTSAVFMTPHNDLWQPALGASASFLKSFQYHSVFLRDSGPWIDVSGVSTVEIWWVVDWRHQRWQCSRNSCVQERFVFLAFNGTEPLQKHTGAVIKGFVIVSLCLLFCSFHQGHLL